MTDARALESLADAPVLEARARASHVAYRPDIDGLRAVAVVPVVLFHAFPAVVTGGYVGVDVFFVISGFLITEILLREVAEGRFSVLRFYVRRARRLFPALLVVLAATLVLGWAFLVPNEYALLGKHVLGGTAFVSNLVLWREVDYFDVDAELKPLLHLWSLGVEEQYYLFWPIVVYLLAHHRPRLFWILAAGLAATSFALGAALVHRMPALSFYFPATRLWELLAGGALAAYVGRHPHAGGAVSTPRVGHWLSIAGLALIVLAVVRFDSNTAFPGYAALLPVLGTAAIIAAGSGAVVNRYVLSRRSLVWIGLISYPLYLWHWPLLAFTRILQGPHLQPATGAALAVAAVVLAWATYRYVESPIRAPRRNAFATRDAVALWLATVALGACGWIVWSGRVEPRLAASPEVRLVAVAAKDWGFHGNQTWPGDSPDVVLFVGDSHMQHYSPRIERLATERKSPIHTLQLLTEGGCAPVGEVERRGRSCAKFVSDALMRAHAPEVKTVVFAASWVGFAERNDEYRSGDPERRPVHPLEAEDRWTWDHWEDALRDLKAHGKRVVILLSSPRGPLVDPSRIVDRGPVRARAFPATAPSRAELKKVDEAADAKVIAVAQHVGAEVVDPFDELCDAERCPVFIEGVGPVYKDDSHVRASIVRERFTLLDRYIYLPPSAAPAAK